MGQSNKTKTISQGENVRTGQHAPEQYLQLDYPRMHFELLCRVGALPVMHDVSRGWEQEPPCSMTEGDPHQANVQ